MQEIDNLHKGFLRLVLARYVSKRDSCLLLDVDLGVALSDAHHSSAAHPAVHHIEKSDHERRREYPSHQEIQDARARTRIFRHHMDPVGIQKTLRKINIRDSYCIILDEAGKLRGRSLRR